LPPPACEPGCASWILYLTYWFPTRERARGVALFMTAVPIAGVLGSPLSGALLTLDGLAGLAAVAMVMPDQTLWNEKP